MKAKNLLAHLGALVLGAVIVWGIDQLLGISFKDVNAVATITHKVTYMLWGGVILCIGKWLES